MVNQRLIGFIRGTLALTVILEHKIKIMKFKAQLIYKSLNTCFQTSLPVYFYGLPNGEMLVLFASCKNYFPDDTALKWTVAEHLDFMYDYESDSVLTMDSREIDIEEFMELADNLEQRIKTIATFGNFSTKTEAQQYLDVNLYNMLSSQKQKQAEIDYY